MTNKDKKLEIDLEFLDEVSSKPKQPIHEEAPNKPASSVPKKWNWKIISIVTSIIIVVIWAGVSEDSTSPTSTYTPSTANQVKNISADDESIEYGEYRCSQYHYDKAVALSPSESEQTLASAQFSMETRVNEINRLEREIENSYVNEYSSQWEIDDYNDTVETYNSKLTSYQRDATALDTRIDKFNAQVEAHNNYLVQNCSLR